MNIWLLHFETISPYPFHEYVIFIEPDGNEMPSKKAIEGWTITGFGLVSCTLLETENAHDFPSDIPINEPLHRH